MYRILLRILICSLLFGIAYNVSADNTPIKENTQNKIYRIKDTNNGNIKYSDKPRANKHKHERRIYLIDVTQSMEGFKGADNIFDDVKKQLETTIDALTDTTTEIVLIPFTNAPLDMLSQKVSNKKAIIDYIRNLKTEKGDTNILDAWLKGETYLDNDKINYLFMLTDGIHNTGAPIDSLYSTLGRWHEKAEGKYNFI